MESLLGKHEDLSLDAENPNKARCGRTFLRSHSHALRCEAETGDSPEPHKPDVFVHLDSSSQ